MPSTTRPALQLLILFGFSAAIRLRAASIYCHLLPLATEIDPVAVVPNATPVQCSGPVHGWCTAWYGVHVTTRPTELELLGYERWAEAATGLEHLLAGRPPTPVEIVQTLQWAGGARYAIVELVRAVRQLRLAASTAQSEDRV